MTSLPRDAHAQSSRDWQGNDNGNWNWNNQWAGGQAPTAGDRIYFVNNNRLTTTNNSGVNIGQVFFQSGATSARTIVGGVNLTDWNSGGQLGVIENNSTGTHTINGGVGLQGGAYAYQINPRDGNLVISGGVNNLSAGKTLEVFGNNTLTINGGINGGSGVFAIRASGGSATVILRDTSTYTGNTEIDRGVLQLEGTMSSSSQIFIGSGLNDNSAELRLQGTGTFANNVQVNVSGGDGGRTLSKTDATARTASGNFQINRRLNVNVSASGGTLTLSGAITGDSGITKDGAGVLVISGNNSTWNGAIILGAGTLRLGHNSAAGSADITLNGGTIASDSSTARTFANNLSFGGNATFGDATGTGALTFGAVNLGGATRTLTISRATTFSGAVSNGSLTKAGTEQLTLSSDSSSFGTLSISAGTVAINGNTTVTGLAGSGGSLSLGAGKALTVNNSTAQAFSRVISGSGNLIKSGSSSLTLSGANDFTGTTTINGGSIVINDDTRLGAAPESASAAHLTLNGGTLNTTASFTLASNRGITLGSSGGTVNVNSATTLTYGGIITGGANNFTKSGAGILILNGASDYTGTTTVSAGTLQMGAANRLSGSSALSVSSGATFDLNNFSQSLGSLAGAGTIATGTGAGGTLTTTTSGDTTFSGVISGNGNLVKDGSGILRLTGTASTFTGTTTIEGGLFAINGDGSLGAAPGSPTAGKIVIGNGSLGFNTSFTLGANRGISLTSTGSTLNVFDTRTVTYDGIIAGSGTHELNKSGGGTLVLGGASSFSGATTINNGAIRMMHANALGTTGAVTVATGNALQLSNNITVGSKALTLTGTGISDTGALRNMGDDNSWAGDLTLGGNARINSDAGTLTIGGTIAASTFEFYVGGAGNTTINGAISGSNAERAIFKDGAGTLFLGGNNSGLTGGISLRAGAIEIANANALGSSLFLGTASSSAAARLLVNETTSLPGTFAVQNASTGGVVEIDANKVFTITGALNQEGGTSTATRFEKRGAGTLILAGTSGSYNGQIRISDGTVVAGTEGSLGANTATSPRAIDLGLDLSGSAVGNNVSLILSNGVTLGQSIFVAANASGATRTISVSGDSATLTNQIFLGGNLTFDVGGTSVLSVTNSGTATQITSSGGLTKTGTGTLLLRGNQFTGGFSIEAGTVGMYLNSSLGVGTVTINGGALASINRRNTNNNALVVGGNFTLGGLDGNSLLQAGTVNLGGATRQITVIDNAEFGGVVSNGGLTKEGSATLTLSAENTFTGPTTVNQGMLTLSGAGRLAAGTAVTVGSSGTLNFGGIANAVDSFTLNGGVFTNGTLTAANYALQGGTVAGNLGAGTATASSGTTALNGTLDANLTVNGGTVNLGANDRIADAANVTITSGTLGMGIRTDTVNIFTISGGTLGGTGTLTAANGYSLGGGTVSANLGTGALTNTASTALNGTTAATTIDVTGGTLTLGSASRLVGTTPAVSVSGGATLALGGNESMGSLAGAGTVALGTGRTLTVGGANTSTTFSGALTGASSLTKVGSGALTLSGASSTYSGTTTLSNGTLRVGNNAALGSSALRLDGGTFASDSATARTINNNTTVGGNVTFGQASEGTGALTFSNISLATGAARTLTTAQNVTILSLTNVSGAGLIKEGAATLTLGATGTGGSGGTGAVTVNAGELRLANSTGDTVRGALAINSGGTVFLAQGNVIQNDVTVTANGGTLNLGGNADVLGGLVLTNGGLVTNGTFGATNTGLALKDGTIAANISNNILSIVKDSAGTVLLSGTNAYTNVTFIDAGILAVTNGNAIADTAAVMLSNNAGAAFDVRSSETIGSLRGGGASGGNVTISNAAVLTVAEAAVETFAGVISGAGGLTKSGAGTMTLSVNQTYTGVTTINGGTLSYAGTNTTTAVTINSGGTLAGTGSVGATTVKSGGIISPGNSPGTLSVESLTLEGGGIYKWELANATGSTPGTDWDYIIVGGGSGTVTLSATSGDPFIIDLNGNPANWNPANNYSWDIIALGSMTGFNAAAFTVQTNNFTGAAPTGNWIFSTNATHLVLTYTNVAGDPTYAIGNGVWSTGFSPELTTGLNAFFTGAGGTATNDIASGTLSTIGDITFTDTAGAYTLVAGSGASGETGTPLFIAGNIVNQSAATQTINMALEFDSTRTLDAASNNLVFGGAISNIGGMLVTGASSNIFTGVISGAGALTKEGAGTTVLSGANTFTGAVAVNAGTLVVTNGAALANTVAVTLSNNAGATFDVRSSETIGSLAGGGSTGGTVALGANNLTLAGNASTTYGGAITGTGTLIKQGTGTLTFDRASDYGADFDLRLEGGVLDLNRGGGALSGILGSGNVVQMAGGTLRQSASSGGNGTMTYGGLNIYSGTSTLDILRTSGTATHAVTNSATLTFKEAGVLNVTSTGSTNASVLFNQTDNLLEANGTISVGTNMTVLLNTLGESGGARSLTKLGNGVLALRQNNTYTGATIVGQGTLRMELTGADISSSSGVVISNGATFDLNNFSDTIKGLTGAGAVTLGSATLTVSNTTADTFSGGITGTGGVTKSGTGTLVLSAANSYSGTTTLAAGTLRVGNDASLGSGGLTLNAGTLASSSGSAHTLANNVTMGGNMQFGDATGTGNLTLSGTVNLGAATRTLTISNVKTRVDGVVSGSGGLTKEGTGTLRLTAANTYTGTTTLSGGTLRIDNASALGTGNLVQTSGGTLLQVATTGTITNTMSIYNVSFTESVTLTGAKTLNNATIDVETGDTVTEQGVLSGTGGLTKEGGGEYILNGSANNTYSGATEVNAGTLTLANTDGSKAINNSSSITVNTGGTLKLGADDQVGTGIDLILAGGTFITGDASSRYSASFGTLTLTADSTIDLGAWAGDPLNPKTISFADSSLISWGSSILTISNWQGVAYSTSDVSKILFGDAGLTSAQLGQIRFADQGDLPGGFIGDELVPVPEPRVYAAAVALLAVVGWRERKRLLALLSRKRTQS